MGSRSVLITLVVKVSILRQNEVVSYRWNKFGIHASIALYQTSSYNGACYNESLVYIYVTSMEKLDQMSLIKLEAECHFPKIVTVDFRF